MKLRRSFVRSWYTHPRFGALARKSGAAALVLIGARAIAADAQIAHLTVRPHEMATGMRNDRAGDSQLDSLPEGYWVYVPPSCVGAQRCPLVVYLLPGDNGFSKNIRVTADDYKTIMLFINDEPWRNADKPNADDVKTFDTAIHQVFQRFAIDPDRVAIIGNCATAVKGMMLGATNWEVFNRVAVLSGHFAMDDYLPLQAQDTTTEWFSDQGLPETGLDHFQAAQALQSAGHPAKAVVSLRGHESLWETYDFLWRWLMTSWAIRDPAARPAPRVVTDSLPVSTVEAVTRMTAFWTRFMQEPESIRTTGRRAHLQEVVVPISGYQTSILMTAMPALAAAYPSVAADLKAAGLTAQEHDAYRLALVSAYSHFTMLGKVRKGPDERMTRQEQENLTFFEQHPDELEQLSATGMWTTP